VIGVIGGYGTAGRNAVRRLHDWGAGPLRIGGRDVAAARRAAESVGAEPAVVDVGDDASLATFVRDCAVVVNCAGPSHRIAGRVARAAVAAGAHHVDAGLLTEFPAPRCVLYGAGAVPGMSGLLPRWLAAQGFDSVHRLTSYTGVFDRFTPAAAEDFLQVVAGAPPTVGGRQTRELPFFPREVTAAPYADAETARVARDLSLAGGDWYTVLDGERLGAALDAARGLPLADAVAGLCRAAALDVAGRAPYVKLLAQLDGVPGTRTAVVRAPGVAELTGAMTAAAALAVFRGEVAPGNRPAAVALDPARTVERLRAVCDVAVFDAPVDELVLVEEGAL
jgi:hypothetical protein